MQSIIIVGQKEKIIEEAQKICKEFNISKFDIQITQTEKAVGIPDIRLLQKNIFLTPVQGDKKAVVLESFSGMTNDAQNSFLKILEEPPESTIIMILALSLDFLLPTVISRCKIINLTANAKLSGEDKEDFLKLFIMLKKSRISTALSLAQDNGKSREDALSFLEKAIAAFEGNLESNNDIPHKEKAKTLKNLQTSYTIIKTTNVSPRFALENLFLNLK